MQNPSEGKAANRLEKAFHAVDFGLSRLICRSLALLCFAIIGWNAHASWAARAQFETVENYVGTAAFLGVFLGAGIWLWRRKGRFSDTL